MSSFKNLIKFSNKRSYAITQYIKVLDWLLDSQSRGRGQTKPYPSGLRGGLSVIRADIESSLDSLFRNICYTLKGSPGFFFDYQLDHDDAAEWQWLRVTLIRMNLCFLRTYRLCRRNLKISLSNFDITLGLINFDGDLCRILLTKTQYSPACDPMSTGYSTLYGWIHADPVARDECVSQLSNCAVKVLKAMCLSPTCVLNGTSEELRCPLLGHELRSFKTWLKSKNSLSKETFCNTMLQLKRVAERVPTCFVKNSLEKHQSYISNPFSRQPREMKLKLIEKSKSYLRKWSPKLQPTDVVDDLSLRACIESSRENGGTYGFWRRKMPDSVTITTQDDLTCAQLGLRFPFRSEVFEELKNLKNFRRKVVPILEPLKVRVITLGHAAESPMWAQFQKSLARRLAKDDAVLSGKEFGSEPFQKCFEDLRWNESLTREPWTIISDDGDAATDSIHPNLTIGMVIDKIPSRYRHVFSKSFFSTCEYSDKIFPEENCFPQMNGQLMGDRRSFPILCLIHLLWKRIFIEEHELLTVHSSVVDQYFKLKEIILINGDDGVIGIPLRLKQDYLDWMSLLWSMNPLKTFEGRSKLSFNSKLWKYSELRKECYPVPLIRWNLIHRIDKFGDQSMNPQIWNDVKLDAPELFQPYLFRIFVKHWKVRFKYLDDFDPGHNWFLPLSCGGLGLEPPHGWSFRISGRQWSGVRECEQSLGLEKIPAVATRVAIHRDQRPRFSKIISPYPKKWGWASGIREPRPGNFKNPCNQTKLMMGKLPKTKSRPIEFTHMRNWQLTYDIYQDVRTSSYVRSSPETPSTFFQEIWEEAFGSF